MGLSLKRQASPSSLYSIYHVIQILYNGGGAWLILLLSFFAEGCTNLLIIL